MRRVVSSFAACLAALLCMPAPAGIIGLSWDPAAGATGYRVYYGSSPGSYQPTPIYQGPATSATINNASLTGCTTWHFAVTAYNSAGESDFSSNVSSWPRPEITSTSPATAMQGSIVALTVTGKSFPPGAVLQVDDPNVVLDNPASSCTGSCTCQYQVLATVEPMAGGAEPAEIGDRTLTVVTPDGLADTVDFEVLVNPLRFDLNRTLASTDRRLDGMDTSWLAKRFGVQSGNVNFDPDYDFDGDGWIDGGDLTYIGSNFGRCWAGTSWNVAACD